jgi:hypothetical protein
MDSWLGTSDFHDLVTAGGGGLWRAWLAFMAAHGGLAHYASTVVSV